MTTTTFAIGGMHCAACAVRNERTLLKTPGVSAANVNLGTRRARVEFDETAVSEAALREAVIDNGYEVLRTTMRPAITANYCRAGSADRSVACIRAIVLGYPCHGFSDAGY